jgi:hypothetical protein
MASDPTELKELLRRLGEAHDDAQRLAEDIRKQLRHNERHQSAGIDLTSMRHQAVPTPRRKRHAS